MIFSLTVSVNIVVRATGVGGCSTWQKHDFYAKAKFCGQKPAAKNEKFLYVLNGIYSAEKCPKSAIFTNNYWVG